MYARYKIVVAILLLLMVSSCNKTKPTLEHVQDETATPTLPSPSSSSTLTLTLTMTATPAPPTLQVRDETATPIPPTATPPPPTTTPVPPTPTATPTLTPIPWPTAESYFDGVRITFVNNAGFLITVGDKKILIDALFEGYNPGDAPPQQVLDRAVYARPPFDEIDLILVTHEHLDHFSDELVRNFMIHNSDAVLVSTRTVVRGVQAFGDDIQERVIPIQLGPGEQEEIVVNDIGLGILYISHGEGAPRNFGFVITVGEFKFFHTGDMVVDAVSVADLQAYGLPAKQIDVAFVGLWMLAVEEYHPLVLQGIQARHLIPMHYPYKYPPADIKAFPDAIIFHATMESWTLP